MFSLTLASLYAGVARVKPFPQIAAPYLRLSKRRYTLASLSDISAESKANIIRYVRSSEDKGLVVAWRDLACLHNISEAVLKQIVAEDTAERQKQQELSKKITEAAVSSERYYNNEKGFCNWEALSVEFGLPLVDCLRAFNPAKSPHKLRLMPEPSEWTHEDKVMLHSLLCNTFNNIATADWSLVGVYMNTEPDTCKSAAKLLMKIYMSPEFFKNIQKLRKQGLKWSEIHSHYPYISTAAALMMAYNNYKRKVVNTSTLAVWTKTDGQRMSDLLRKHRHDVSEDVERTYKLVASEFSNLSENLVRRKFCEKLRNLQADSFKFLDYNRLQQLVAEHGENWKRIDSELDSFPGAAKYNWNLIKGLNLTKSWSLEDTKRLYHCINTNMNIYDSIRYIGTKSPRQYLNMNAYLKMQALAGSARTVYGKNAQWSDEEKARLFELVALSTDVANTTWVSIAKQLSHSVPECIYTYHMLQASDWRPSTVSNESKVEMVTQVCKEEYMSAGCIDWVKVSKLTGLNQLECMAVCDMEDYKSQWIYDADTFSWDDANRMTDFIAANYPGTLPVNYRAVSNYMWIKIGDCINMHNMLQGKFRCTNAVMDRIVQMRSQGHTFRYIANQLSPLLDASTVNNAYSRHTRVHTPISEEEKQRITELVDKYVDKVPVKEVMKKVKSESASWSYSVTQFASAYIQNHAYYRKRLVGMDLTEITDRILSGKLTIKHAAAELDITSTLLGNVIRLMKIRDYSSKWTAAETEQLIAYVRALGNEKPDWVYCARLIGTKHYTQCRKKFASLKNTNSI